MSCGLILGVFAPQFPPPVPTSDSIIEAAKAVNGDYIVAVPAVIEVYPFILVCFKHRVDMHADLGSQSRICEMASDS